MIKSCCLTQIGNFSALQKWTFGDLWRALEFVLQLLALFSGWPGSGHKKGGPDMARRKGVAALLFQFGFNSIELLVQLAVAMTAQSQ